MLFKTPQPNQFWGLVVIEEIKFLRWRSDSLQQVTGTSSRLLHLSAFKHTHTHRHAHLRCGTNSRKADFLREAVTVIPKRDSHSLTIRGPVRTSCPSVTSSSHHTACPQSTDHRSPVPLGVGLHSDTLECLAPCSECQRSGAAHPQPLLISNFQHHTSCYCP